ncbi:hypothetical protein GBA65_14390 [Rubrobacter marinus]|uniref:Uncharacterized protein n=1 Tax=Rubrobacter marinus TaxID=2653852 RepID=A0A6G8PZ67_9ACTN|nr:hypothetical protein [Rubrobacter marinus]QIN79511.1 hypothetical protein GBA65_14390 [Rubrobacter marinus]
MLRAALLRPWPLIVLVIGLVFFALTLTWWALPLTAATYAALVALAVRDPIFQTLVLEGREKARLLAQSRARQISGQTPKTRARRLREGETRDRLEAALEARERVLVAINGSDEETRNLFAGAVPQLERAAELLVDLAEAREQAPQEERNPGALSAIDAELSRAPERFHALRSEVVRASIESDADARDRAESVRESLDETNRRLRELRASA